MINSDSNDIDKELSVGLLRQRRNLILISLVMPLFFLSGASVNEINLFGTVISVKSQAGIKTVIFVLYFYFLWRYYQYYREEQRAESFRSIRDEKLYKTEFDFFSTLMRPLADCFEFQHYYPCFKLVEPPVFSVTRVLPDKALDRKAGFFRRFRLMEIYGLANKYEDYYLAPVEDRAMLSDDEIEKIGKRWRLVKKELSDARSGAVFETDVEYSTLKLAWIRFTANLKFYITHPYFSDYELPFLIAEVSLILTIAYI